MKKMFVYIGAFLVVSAIAVTVVIANEENEVSKLLNANVEALARDEISATTCLGLWGECTLPDGTESKAPAVHIEG